MRDFFGCYLLESKHPKGKGHTYIGFTVNPRRRIRQHNGEITSGAAKTKSRRPWEMALVVYGFPTQVQALQFEWAWQHPEKSLDVRDIVAKLGRKKRYGVAGKVLLLMEMLRAEPWCYYPLTLQFLSSTYSALRGRCPPPPVHMQVLVAPLEALPEVVEDAADPPEEEEDGGSEDGSDGGGCSSDEGSMWPDGSLLHRAQPSSQAASLLTGAAAAAAAAAPALGRQQFDVASSSSEDGGPAQMAAGASQAVAAAAAAAEAEPAPGGKGKGKAKGGARAAARAATACKLCSKAANRTWVPCSCCGVRTHVECLARHFLQSSGNGSGSLAGGPASGLLPSRGACPGCGVQLTWMEVLLSVDNVGWEGKSGRRRAGGKAAAAASSEAAGAAAAQQGSPSESAAGKARKPRGRKPAAATAAAARDAAAGGDEPLAGGIAPAAAEAVVPKPKRGRPRKLQPLLGPDPSSSSGQQQQQQQQAGSYTELEVLEALPWDDFGLSSPVGAAVASAAASPGSSSRRPGRQRQVAQQQQQQQDVVELLDSDDDGLSLPLAERLQQLHARQPPGAERAEKARGGAGFAGPPPPPQQLEDQEQGTSPWSPLLPQRQQVADGPGGAAAAAPAAADGDVMDLVSPSPLPLLERLAKQQLRGAQSPRATPSPAPQRKLQKRFQAADADAIDGSGVAAAAAAWQQAEDGSDVIVISDSE